MWPPDFSERDPTPLGLLLPHLSRAFRASSPRWTGVEELPPAQGTAADFMDFLEWAEKKGELSVTTVQNWRNASTKVLEIEDNWRDLDLVALDLDALLDRFQTLKRTSYTNGSMAAYRSRRQDRYRGLPRMAQQLGLEGLEAEGGHAARRKVRQACAAAQVGAVHDQERGQAR